jgi:hypothetical protein
VVVWWWSVARAFKTRRSPSPLVFSMGGTGGRENEGGRKIENRLFLFFGAGKKPRG